MLRQISVENLGNFRKKNQLKFLKKIQRYEIVVYVILFALFLALKEDKPHSNMLNSLGAMIFVLLNYRRFTSENGKNFRIKTSAAILHKVDHKISI